DEGYQVFTRRRPSPQYQEIVVHGDPLPAAEEQPQLPQAAAKLAATLGVHSVLPLDLGRLAGDWPKQPFDAVIAAGLLQRLPAEDVPWLLAEMFGQAGKLVYVAVDCQDGASNLCVREPGWGGAPATARSCSPSPIPWAGRTRSRSWPTTASTMCRTGCWDRRFPVSIARARARSRRRGRT